MFSARQQLSQLFYTFGKKSIIRYMADLDRLQWQPKEDILALQKEQTYHMLVYAKQYVPYYQDLFAKVGFQPDDFIHDPKAIEKIPLLTKTLIRQNYNRLTTTDPAKQAQLYKIKTGGTTGEPLLFTKDHTYRDYNIAHDYHVMTWSGWQLGQPQFWLWGHVPDKPAPVTWGSRLKDWLAVRYNSDAFILTPENMGDFKNTLEKYPGGILWSYVSTAHRFAQFLQETGHGIHLTGVYTAAEPLFPNQQQFMQQVFGCPVFNNYSSIDTGDIASECEEHNGLHTLSRNCYVEVVQEGEAVADGEEGEFVLTTLTNYGMPLIRYQIEDWGAKSARQCPCGRGLPLLKVVEGRKIDLFKTRDGKTVYGAFAKDLVPTLGDVKQFQVVQKSFDLVIFKIVHQGTLDEDRLQKIVQVSKAALGDEVEVKFEYVSELPTTPTGKHRYLVSEVT